MRRHEYAFGLKLQLRFVHGAIALWAALPRGDQLASTTGCHTTISHALAGGRTLAEVSDAAG